jgi:hypothetical protein
MTFDEFVASLERPHTPEKLLGPLHALWLDGKGHWDQAHGVVEKLDGRTAASVHAYLHRKEGDVSNAGYWYGQAGRKRPVVPLGEEWEALTRELLP